MHRHSFSHAGLTLSYLDSGGPGRLIIALHALWMEAGTYAGVAQALAPDWRVVALDQRGHGDSDHAKDYALDAFVGDVGALVDHLGADGPVVLLGNSMGAMNAFHFAARHPERVRALINEEGPAEQHGDFGFVLAWAGIFPTREALANAVGERLFWSVEPSVIQTPQGWTLKFDPHEIKQIADNYQGDWWRQWLASSCPALVVRGADSQAVDGAVMEAMAKRRPDTALTVLRGGHVIHAENAPDFLATLRPFLDRLEQRLRFDRRDA